MQQALNVAEAALAMGEVPVGCVIVLREAPESQSTNTKLPVQGDDEESNTLCSSSTINIDTENNRYAYAYEYKSSPQVIVSHGANQVNATRDATRHSECVAIDRMLTGGLMSDQSRLPQHMIAKAAHGKVPDDCPLHDSVTADDDLFHDDWVNIEDQPNHWKNTYGWGSGRLFNKDIFQKCDLYVTCEPCIMVS